MLTKTTSLAGLLNKFKNARGQTRVKVGRLVEHLRLLYQLKIHVQLENLKQQKKLNQAQLNKWVVSTYKVLGFTVLTVIVLGLVSYLAQNLYYWLSSSWIEPTVISATDERVMALSAKLAETSSVRDKIAADLADADRVIAMQEEFLLNAQGEDVVAGIRTPEPIERMQELMPEAYEQLADTLDSLEAHYRDMQDIEFTVEEGTLYLLQTRTGKRTAAAALRVAAEMVDEGLISREEAVVRIDPAQLDQLLHPMIDPHAKVDVAAQGLNVRSHLVIGEPVDVIARLVESLGIDLLILGHSRAKSFALRWWRGSVDAMLMDRVRCSILVAADVRT
jgi:nucleotide-binding universal stress UspA family protein